MVAPLAGQEELRPHFVSHEGKKELIVQRPEFVKGSPANDWEGVFPEFSEQIAANTAPGTIELIQNDFSTTGPMERVVSHITLMDTVQHYFSYTMCCGCGFPQITLSGTPEDWEKIRARAEGLRKYGLGWWLDALLPALDQFVSASHGKPDLDFWRALCNINTGTSFPHYEPLTGWVQVSQPSGAYRRSLSSLTVCAASRVCSALKHIHATCCPSGFLPVSDRAGYGRWLRLLR